MSLRTTPSRRRVLIALAAVPFLLSVSVSAAAPYGVVVRRSTADARRVEGSVVVPMSASTAWSELAGVGGWAQLFGDIVSMTVRSHAGNRWVLAVVSGTLGGHAHDYTVDVGASSKVVQLSLDVTGLDAHGTMSVVDGPSAGTSTLRFDLLVQKSGVAGWFVSEKTIREKQEKLVFSYLRDFAKASGVQP